MTFQPRTASIQLAVSNFKHMMRLVRSFVVDIER